MGYRGQPYKASPAEASAGRVLSAAQGSQGNMSKKIGQVAEYIRIAANETHGGDVRRVPCPPAAEWAELSCGRHAALPTEMQLTVHADPNMQGAALRLGSMREAYFAAARDLILGPPKKKAD